MPDHGSHTDSWVSRWMVGFVGWVARHPKLVLAFCLVTSLLSVLAARDFLQYRTQRDDLMSAEKDCRQRWRNYLAEFGSDDDMVVVAEGQNPQRIRMALEAIADRIRQQPGRYDRLFYKVDLTAIRNRALLYLPSEQLAEVKRNVAAMAPLGGSLAKLAWQQMSLATILANDDGSPERIRQLSAIARSASIALGDPSQYVNPWNPPGQTRSMTELDQPTFFFSQDQTLAFLLVRPQQVDESFTPAAEAVQGLRDILDTTRREFSDLQFGLTGLPVLEHDEMAAADADTNLASWLALGGVALLYFFVYRGFRYPLLTVSTLIVGTIWALGLTTITIGHLNILSSTFAVMLIGMGDYGVLWVARFEDERKHDADVTEAMRRTAAHAGPSILTAASTTALAFYATMFADFLAVAELGFIAGSGVLLCALSCFTIMPALLVLVDRKKPSLAVDEAPRIIPLASAFWLPRMTAHPKWVIGIACAILAVTSYYAAQLRYDPNLLNMQACGLDSVDWERKLLDRTTGTSWNALSIANSPQEAIELRAKYEQLPEVSQVIEVASLVPTDQEAKLPILAEIHEQLAGLPANLAVLDRPQLGIGELRALLTQRIASFEERKISAEAIESFRALDRALSNLSPDLAGQRLKQFEDRLIGDLHAGLVRLRDVSHPQPINLEDLPPDLRERYIGQSGKYLVRAFAKDNIWEYDALAKFVAKVQTIDSDATGKPFGTLEGLRTMTAGFLWAGLYALIAIIVILSLDFRSMRSLLLGLLPLIVGVVGSLGILQIFGFPLNPANLIALPLIVGVGVDNGVHLLHDYRAKIPGSIYRMSTHTGRGIFVAALTTILGFGTLMISRHQGMFGLGLTLTLGVTICMITALVVLPAVLRVIDSRSRGRKQVRDPKTHAA